MAMPPAAMDAVTALTPLMLARDTSADTVISPCAQMFLVVLLLMYA